MRIAIFLYLITFLSCDLNGQEKKYNSDDSLSLAFHYMYPELDQLFNLKGSDEWKKERVQNVEMSCTNGQLALDTIYGEGPLGISYTEMEYFAKYLSRKQKCNQSLKLVYVHLDMNKKLDEHVTFIQYYEDRLSGFMTRNNLSEEIAVIPRSFSAKVTR